MSTPSDIVAAGLANNPATAAMAATMPSAVPNLLQRAIAEYPYLKGKDIAYVNTPMPNKAMLESWPPNEEGSKDWLMRPKEIPMDKFGVQILDPKTTPKDVLADYVSHWATNPQNPGHDKKLTALYQQFAQKLDPEKLKQQYEWSVKNAGEKRPFEQWAQQSGIPSAFRGYTFDQWPKDFNERYYTNEARSTLDEVRAILGIK